MQHRLLIVDPDHDLCKQLVAFFDAVGHEVTLVHDGREALPAARVLQPDVALVEVVLPGVSGYEVCHELREEFGPRLPIILAADAALTSGSGRSR